MGDLVVDRRSERRLRMLKSGNILLDDFVTVSCTVRDISASGARLELNSPVCLPSAFRLHLLSADLVVPAAVVWQRRLEAGILFTDAGAPRAVQGASAPIAHPAG